MNAIPTHGGSPRAGSTSRVYTLALVTLSLGAITATYVLSLYTTDVTTKTGAFSAVIVVFLMSCLISYLLHSSNLGGSRQPSGQIDLEARLQVLDDAREFLGGSLKTADAFRLAVSRINDLVPFTGVQLLLLDEPREAFVLRASDGPVIEANSRVPLDSGIVGLCYRERDVAIDNETSSAAVPLKRNAEVFGVLKFALAGDQAADASILDAIGERVAPLILASIAHERTQANALTDATTDLPNERAFHLVLENQVAESIRKGSSRALSILTTEIRNLDHISSHYGHAAGDRMLNFAAEGIKDSLRQMDFLARGGADEFLVIMPTASQQISHEIIARIQTSIFDRKLTVSETDAVEIDLGFGWASFGIDGETPTTLLSAARERMQQNRSGLAGSVLWFPQETAH